MSAEPESAPAAPNTSVCPLCGARVARAVMRCESCGMTLAGTGIRHTLWVWAGVLLVIYLIVLAVVASVHD
jgi:hypothetical protein